MSRGWEGCIAPLSISSYTSCIVLHTGTQGSTACELFSMAKQAWGSDSHDMGWDLDLPSSRWITLSHLNFWVWFAVKWDRPSRPTQL